MSEPQAGSKPNGAVIELSGIHKAFGRQPVLRGVDLTIREGETTTILGGSGSGKSVCLKHMIGLLRPDRGRVRVFGRDLATASDVELLELRRRMGMLATRSS